MNALPAPFHHLPRRARPPIGAWFLAALFAGCQLPGTAADAPPTGVVTLPDCGLEFIDTSFENASPLWYAIDPDGTVQVHLIYDHERSSPNRAAGHWHFLLQGRPGAQLRLVLNNLDNIWNGQPGSIAREQSMTMVSTNGRDWHSVPLKQVPVGRLQLDVQLPGPRLYVARVEPYRLSDLEKLLASIRDHPAVEITPIGRTVEGRPLEIVRIGAPAATRRVFIRARAHPWEAGGNWVVQGLIHRLLAHDREARRYREDYCVYVMPLANKDGVARGGTRFNLQGKDLNRNWDQPADPELAPENHALETWLEAMIRKGQRPDLAFDFHNDGEGRLHVSRPPGDDPSRSLERMPILEKLLRQHTWFTEGTVPAPARNSGSIGDGWAQRYGIGSVVHELNASWIAGLNDTPGARHWERYGAQLCRVLDEYFQAVPLCAERRLALFHQPPADFAGQFGTYRSPLLFSDGTPVKTSADWPRRRAEILQQWRELLGPWPPVLEAPRVEILQSTNRDSILHQRVRIQIAPDQAGEGWLLKPPGGGPFPAVLVVYYEPETSVGLNAGQPWRDFGLQLARRGFVTLSIGTPGGNAWQPELGMAQCQPLSFHAYVAANCWQALAQRPEVDRDRIGVVGHSYGGKWALFAAAFWDRFACVVVSDPGVVFDESRPNVNYWEPWYLGRDLDQPRRKAGVPTADNPRTGAYRRLVEGGHDLHELHALIAPHPFLVSGGSEDPPARWVALNHALTVNRLLGYTNRVALTSRPSHNPTAESNEEIYAFFERFLNTAVPVYYPPPESQGGWRRLDQPDDLRRLAGVDPDKLAALREWLLQSDDRDFAADVIRRGYLVLEVERGNSARTDARRVASVSKAVCATVLAIAAERSQRGSTPRKMTFDDRAFEFIPWAQPLSDPRKARITVRQLLNHTSGLCPEATGAPNDGSWEYILGHTGDPRTVRLAFDPGTGCGYSTHALAHAALVCETVTGQPYDQFAIEALFQPLGIEHWWFQFYDGGESVGRHPSHGMGMPARDLARIAYCMVRGGRWHDRQIIPVWFVEQTAAPTHNVTTPEMRWKLNPQIFSHGWELPARHSAESGKTGAGIPADARYKPGSGGQLIAFVPSLDLVITRQTGSSGDWPYEEYLRRACAAVR